VSERSVHDNRVTSYEVDAERRRIVLHTRFDERQPLEHTDVVFEGVHAYHFEHDNFGNILFGVGRVSSTCCRTGRCSSKERSTAGRVRGTDPSNLHSPTSRPREPGPSRSRPPTVSTAG
jgi:hypothetical protein